ncbi:hypothetical protein ACFLXO_08355 [Chloroflexota bacterium]
MEYLLANIKPLFRMAVIIIASVLCLWGAIKAKWGMIVVGFSFIAAVFISNIYESQQFSAAMSTISVIVLAIVAIATLIENMRLRKQSYERDERDRKERRLSEIIQWATDAVDVEFGKYRRISINDFESDSTRIQINIFEYTRLLIQGANT